MRGRLTAILHLEQTIDPEASCRLRRTLAALRGVRAVRIEPREPLVVVRVDRNIAGLGEIVRLVEDTGHVVVGVAQRAGARTW